MTMGTFDKTEVVLPTTTPNTTGTITDGTKPAPDPGIFDSLKKYFSSGSTTGSTTPNSTSALPPSNPDANYSTPTSAASTDEQIKNLGTTGQVDHFTTISAGIAKTPAEKAREDAALADWKAKHPSKTLNSSAAVSAKAAVTALKSPRENNDDVMAKLTSTITGEQVRMIVSPNISEERSATYDSIKLIHHPGQLQLYNTTESRNYTIEAKFISRNSNEATQNLIYFNLIRSWVMPYYGTGTKGTDPSRYGAPPDVLKFEAYGSGNIKGVPVVLQNYSTRYDNAVDYIPTTDGTPFPVILDITLKLVESYSPAEFSKFSLRDYKNGILPIVTTPVIALPQPAITSQAPIQTPSEKALYARAETREAETIASKAASRAAADAALDPKELARQNIAKAEWLTQHPPTTP